MVSSASRGLAPREGLEMLLSKLGRTGPLVEPRRGPQAGKSGDPRSQNADSSPRAQGTLAVGFEAKPRGKCGVPRAPTACGLGRRVAVDWTWASPLPHAASATARLESPCCMQKVSSLSAIVEVDGWPPLGFKWGGAKAPVAHLLLLRLLCLPPFDHPSMVVARF